MNSQDTSAPDDAFFLERIDHIRTSFASENRPVCMGLALMGMGKRNARLHAAALRVAKAIGPIRFSDDTYEPLNVAKHLTTERLKKKLGVRGKGRATLGPAGTDHASGVQGVLDGHGNAVQLSPDLSAIEGGI